MEVRSALGPAITRAGGIKPTATFANGLAARNRSARPCPRIRDVLARPYGDGYVERRPPGVTISDVNHGAGGPECGRSMMYWLCAAVSFLAAAWAIVAWLVMWIVSLLTVVRK
jgi:hypothetical protein